MPSPLSVLRDVLSHTPAPAGTDRDETLALVYRGPATLPGCPEAVAAVLEETGMRVKYVGPREWRRLDGPTLAEAALYAQPGGGDLDDAWPHLGAHADDIRGFVEDGGLYLGFCLGAYLAGDDPGFDLLPGQTDQYVTTRGASIDHEGDALVALDWAGTPRTVYFQDGAHFELKRRAEAEVVARYDNGRIAALVCDRGAGRVAVVGPHPEATREWFTDAGLTPPEPLAIDLAVDLVERLRRRGPGPARRDR